MARSITARRVAEDSGRGHAGDGCHDRSHPLRWFGITPSSLRCQTSAGSHHVEIRHLAPQLQVGVRDHQECACRRSRSYGLSSRAHRLLQVPDGRRNHCRPQTSIATPFVRRLLLSPPYLSLMAHVSTLRLERWRIGRVQGARNGTAPGPVRAATSLDALGMSRAVLGRCRRTAELNRFSWKAPA
jgi:hypothetical protein